MNRVEGKEMKLTALKRAFRSWTGGVEESFVSCTNNKSQRWERAKWSTYRCLSALKTARTLAEQPQSSYQKTVVRKRTDKQWKDTKNHMAKWSAQSPVLPSKCCRLARTMGCATSDVSEMCRSWREDHACLRHDRRLAPLRQWCRRRPLCSRRPQENGL